MKYKTLKEAAFENDRGIDDLQPYEQISPKKISFKDLSIPLKIAVWLAWISGILSFLGFIVGFIQGASGA